MPDIPRRKRRVTEATVQDHIRKYLAGQSDVTLYRNHVGSIKDAEGRWFSFGLGEGTSDLVGWIQVLATPIPARGGVVTVARMLAIEIKAPGKEALHPERIATQQAWLAFVRRSGGVAAMVTTVDEVAELLTEARSWRV
jgi:hypothetical protein